MKKRRNIFIRMWRQRKIPGLRPLGRIRRFMTRYYDVFGSIPKPDKWVFIVGCGSSGSTLLQKMIGSHPLVGTMPKEGQYYTDQFTNKTCDWSLICLTAPTHRQRDENELEKVDPKKLKRQWGARFNDWTRPVLLEKTPGNTRRMHWLQKHFENTHFIGIVRNGYAVAESICRKRTHDIRTAAKRWANSNEIMLADFEHLERKKLIRYETLAEKPQECIREICEFIGIDPDEISIEGKWKIRRETSTISNKNYRSFEKLSEDDLRIIEEEAGDMLKKLGYSRPM
ncbi:sulfotransferase [Planctomycetota bacterium]